ncbi:MAG: helix-turn-helix transcriptional regulator [Turneriella sp.]|nr:helix-turn-helix transcriptional regulator [Turneriella sp.]
MTEFQKTVFKAAEELFALGGYEGTSISDIAARAGIAKSTVLHHFPSKKRLYQKVMKQSIDQFSGILDGAAVEGDTEAQVIAKFHRLLRWMIAEPVHAKLLNRIYLDIPQTAPRPAPGNHPWLRSPRNLHVQRAAQRYWLPLMDRLTAVFPPDFPVAREELRLFVLFIINSVFQMALSIELQVLLIDERVSREELCRRYEILVAGIIHERLFSPPVDIPLSPLPL